MIFRQVLWCSTSTTPPLIDEVLSEEEELIGEERERILWYTGCAALVGGEVQPTCPLAPACCPANPGSTGEQRIWAGPEAVV